MTPCFPCSRCLRVDCDGTCDGYIVPEIAQRIAQQRLAEGTQPGTKKRPRCSVCGDTGIRVPPDPVYPPRTCSCRGDLVGQRVAVTYQHVHQRRDSITTETRHAIGRVASILPDGALWVVTDREGGIRIEATNVEVAE